MTDPRSERDVQQVPVWFLLAMMALMSVTALGFLYLGTRLAPGANLPAEELKILSRAYDRIDAHYIQDLSDERRAELMHAAVSGMVEKLDDYSQYYPPARNEDYNQGTRGIVTGIGVVTSRITDELMVLYPVPGGPAEHAGVQVGDVIRAVDGQPVTDHGEAMKRIRGELRTKVKLVLARGGEESEIVVVRDNVPIPSVQWARVVDRDARIGYAYLGHFTENSAVELDMTLQHLDGEVGGRLAGLVLDLRQNPGGLLETCLAVTNLFVKDGTLVTLRQRTGPDTVHTADPAKCTRPDLALVLILDGGSASASEVFAGALQDLGRATAVGTRSYGKGVVQSVFSWAKRKERVKITTSYYVTPKGRNIENRLRPEAEQGKGGIEPDTEVAFRDRKLNTRVIQRLQVREVPRKYRKQVEALAAERSEIRIDEPLTAVDDVQLAVAIEELRSKLGSAK